MAILGLSLIIQWRILLGDNDKRIELGKQLLKLAYAGCIPIGVALSLIGLLEPAFMESFVPVGVVLIILSITLLFQSQALCTPEDKIVSFGKIIREAKWVIG